MKKMINAINTGIHKISITFVILLFSIIVIGMIGINSVYLYIDKPDFQINKIGNYLGIIINIVGILILVVVNKFLKNKFPQSKYISIGLFILYFILFIFC